MKTLKDIILEKLINEKLIINKNLKLKERTPKNSEEESCKILADICKETVFDGIELKESDFFDVEDICRIDKAFNEEKQYADDFFNKRSSIIDFSVSTLNNKEQKSIEILSRPGEFKHRVFVLILLNNDKIDHINISKNIKEWLL